MGEGHSSCRYIRVEDRIDPMAKGDISLEQMIGIEVMAQTEMQDRIIEVVGPEETLEGIIGKIVEKGTEMKGMVTTTAEIGIDQGRECLQEAIEGTEVLAMIGLD